MSDQERTVTLTLPLRAVPPSERFPNGIPVRVLPAEYTSDEMKHMKHWRAKLDDPDPEVRAEAESVLYLTHETKVEADAVMVSLDKPVHAEPEPSESEPEPDTLFQDESVVLPALNKARETWEQKRGHAHAERDEAIRRVDTAADPSWKEKALEAIHELALKHSSLIADDVWGLLGEAPIEPRVMGPIMLSAQKKGWIEGTPDTREGTRGVNHARPQRVWRSLVYGGGE